MTQLSEGGETERAIETGEQLLRLDPLHESAVRRLMRLYAGSGRRSVAIQLYRTLADALKTELDAQPEAETRAVFAEITRGGEEQAPSSAATASPSMARASDAPLAPLPLAAPRPGAAISAARRVTRSTRNWVLAGGLAAAMALVLGYQFAPSPSTTATQQPQAGEISVVVLPFTNLSGDPEQEYFSDGMTEEITAALARVPSLRVIGRTSAFQFKGQSKDFAAIRRALNVPYLVDGSVRMEGDRVRITAQLIQADSGVSVWTESYDRQLDGVFATQEDIARTIATSLRLPLGLKPGDNLVNNRGIDPESYQQYLRAKALILARGEARLDQAAAMLEQVVARNPDYAPAWALLASDYSLMPIFHPARRGRSTEESRRVVDELLRKAEAAAQRAVQLDPNSADGYAALGFIQFVRGKLLLAEDRHNQARALDPNNGRITLLLAEVGRLKEALAIMQQLQALEPFVPLYNRTTAHHLWLDGQNDAAIAILKALPPGQGLNDLAMIYASLGRYAEAADLLENIPAGDLNAAFSKDAARLLRTAPANAAAPQSLPSLGILNWVYLYVGAPERALESYERDVQDGFSGGTILPLVWHASFAPVRKTERFKAYVRARGLVEYWRAKGWPEFCRPVGADDFVCT